MKKIVLTLLTTSAFLMAQNGYENFDYFVGVKHSSVSTEEVTYYGGKERLGNVAGREGLRTELELGFFKKSGDHTYKAFLYGWVNKEKNDEKGVGLGAELGKILNNYGTSIVLGARAGIGEQNVQGKSFMTDNGTSTISFITGQNTTPMMAMFNRNNNIIEIGLALGVEQAITESISVNAGLEYIFTAIDFSYTLANGAPAGVSAPVQDQYKPYVGLSYRF